MKKLLLCLLLLLSTACATNKEYMALLAAQQAISVQQAEAARARYEAMGEIAKTGDSTAKAVAVMAMAMIHMPTVNLPPPPESEALKWAAVIFPTVSNLGMGYFTYKAGAVNSNNQREIALSTNNAFAAMGGSIATAGTAGYPFIQAPQANYTLSGNGVIGNGTYTTTTNTNSGNTTRTCTGGNAGAAVPPQIPGPGGAATC